MEAPPLRGLVVVVVRGIFSGSPQPSWCFTDGMLPRRQSITCILKGQLLQFTEPLNHERRLEVQTWGAKVDGGGRRPITSDSLVPLHRPPEALPSTQ